MSARITSISWMRSAPYTQYITRSGSTEVYYFLNTDGNNAVRALSNSMQAGRGAVEQAMDAGNIVDLRGKTGTEIYNDLFTSTSEFDYFGEPIYATAGGVSLDVEIVDVGEALEVVIGIAFIKRIIKALEPKNASEYQIREAQRNQKALADGSVKALAGGDNPDFSVSYSNQLGPKQPPAIGPPDTFSLVEVDYNRAPLVVRMINTPAQTIDPYSTQTLAWEEIGSNMTVGPTEGYAIWSSQATGIQFGVKVVVPYQVFHMGYSPYYQVYWKTEHQTQDWFTPGDASAPYKFPAALGYDIEVNPNAGGITLSVQVNIYDLGSRVDPPEVSFRYIKLNNDTHNLIYRAAWDDAGNKMIWDGKGSTPVVNAGKTRWTDLATEIKGGLIQDGHRYKFGAHVIGAEPNEKEAIARKVNFSSDQVGLFEYTGYAGNRMIQFNGTETFHE